MNETGNDVFCSALNDFVAQQALMDKIHWWLVRAHSVERWFQFEYAFFLDKHLAGRFAAVCEVQRADIVLYPAHLPASHLPIWKNSPVGKIELKVNGNWYVVGNTFAVIAADVAKVDHYNVPAAALVIWVIAVPKNGSSIYRWIERQIANKTGTQDLATIDSNMEGCSRGFELIAEQPLGLPDNRCGGLSIRLYVHRNTLAREIEWP